MIVLGVLACLLATVAMQLEGVIAKNVAIRRELSGARADVAALRERRKRQLRTISRLSDPAGAIPEIHDKLHLIGAREDLYYVRGVARPTAQPDDWNSKH
ncbi:MAG: hypothetical protein M3R53_06555 [Candidatus Eremiobacteraeota bacterium]|nr:hypothetical protein [Candidatus Eremiobacteraeota bacterium]